MKRVIIQVEHLKIQLTASNEQEVKRLLFDLCEPDEVLTVICGRDIEKIMLKDIFCEY